MGDKTWQDTNANGIQDAGEPGMGGVTIQLLKGSTVVISVVSDASGFFSFTGVAPGKYTIIFLRPAGYSFSPVTNQASKVIDLVTGATALYTVVSGQTISVAAGLYQGVLSGFIPLFFGLHPFTVFVPPQSIHF